MVAVLALFDQGKAQLSAIQITEQPRLLTKSKINCPSYKFCKYFSEKWRSNFVLILVLVLESKGP